MAGGVYIGWSEMRLLRLFVPKLVILPNLNFMPTLESCHTVFVHSCNEVSRVHPFLSDFISR